MPRSTGAWVARGGIGDRRLRDGRTSNVTRPIYIPRRSIELRIPPQWNHRIRFRETVPEASPSPAKTQIHACAAQKAPSVHPDSRTRFVGGLPLGPVVPSDRTGHIDLRHRLSGRSITASGSLADVLGCANEVGEGIGGDVKAHPSPTISSVFSMRDDRPPAHHPERRAPGRRFTHLSDRVREAIGSVWRQKGISGGGQLHEAA